MLLGGSTITFILLGGDDAKSNAEGEFRKPLRSGIGREEASHLGTIDSFNSQVFWARGPSCIVVFCAEGGISSASSRARRRDATCAECHLIWV